MTSDPAGQSAPPVAAEGPRGPFLVGVGASAGGLGPTVELVRALGPSPGLAVVVLHHLDPHHESGLVDILSRATTMPVVAATQGVRVQSNHVYVLPPNATLGIADRVLQVSPRTELRGVQHPIDAFFGALAKNCGAWCAGVLLSGTGSDGSQGIVAIADAGGATFAQDGSAEYRDMPENAIGTGRVDWVLPPGLIAAHLRELAELGPSRVEHCGRDDKAFAQVLTTLTRNNRVDFACYKPTMIRRRVERRASMRGVSDLPTYADLLSTDPEEVDALAADLLIHVTSFFRDPGVFDVLKERVLPELLGRHVRDSSLRVWVPGCSSGEEVYSLAIAVLEFLDDANAGHCQLKIFGTDVSPMAIDKARAGVYPASIVQDVGAGRLQRFFDSRDGSQQISKEVRDLCVFAVHDVTRDPPFSGLDLVSCRNLMIYLGPGLQERVLSLFHYALKEPGYLILGSSETVRTFPGFVVVDEKCRIYSRTSAKPRHLLDMTGSPPVEAAHVAGLVRPVQADRLEVQREADRLVLAAFAPPGLVVTQDLAIIYFRGKLAPFLEPASGVASVALLRMVHEELRLPLRQMLDECASSQDRVCRPDVPIRTDAGVRCVTLHVIPFRVPGARQQYFVVLFNATPGADATALASAESGEKSTVSAEQHVRDELASTRAYLQAVIERLEATNEELRGANEEVVSSNEELRSTNEELQMAKEELQATNEELRTVNSELAERNREARSLSDDLGNVLASVEIPIVLLARDGKIRRFTPAAGRVFGLQRKDVGKPFCSGDMSLPAPGLAQIHADVRDQLSPISRTIQDSEGRWYQLVARPYLTADRRIDGTVLIYVDIDEVKQAEQRVLEAQAYAESIVDTLRESLLVLDADLRVRSVNRTFLETFGLATEELVGHSVYEVAWGVWDIPELRRQLADLGPQGRIEGFRLATSCEAAGDRVFVLNARRIDASPLILLAIEDVTERERAQRDLQRSRAALQDMFTMAPEAILVSDAANEIVFVNQAAMRAFGFKDGEMVGLSVDGLLVEGTWEGQNPMPQVGHPPQQPGRELLGRRRDGTHFPIEVALGTMAAEGGPHVVRFLTDVTARRMWERQVCDYQEKLRVLAVDSILVEERERRRIAGDVHDRIGQSLALAQMKVTQARVGFSGPPAVALDEAAALLAQSLVDARTLTFELSPPILYDLGLNAALAWLVEDFQKHHQLQCVFHGDASPSPVGDETAAVVFRIARELLINVVKHAQASTATVRLNYGAQELTVVIEDDGVGFDPEDPAHPTAPIGKFGLFHLREQVRRLGDDMHIASARSRGTRVTLQIPVGVQPGGVQVDSGDK